MKRLLVNSSFFVLGLLLAAGWVLSFGEFPLVPV